MKLDAKGFTPETPAELETLKKIMAVDSRDKRLSFRDEAVLVLIGGVREKHDDWTREMIERVFNLADAIEAERQNRNTKGWQK